KMFYVEIDSLDRDRGCFASNRHFSELFGLSISRCSEIINSLKNKGFIEVEIEQNSAQSVSRIMRILPPSENTNTPSENTNTPSENTKHPFEKHEAPLR